MSGPKPTLFVLKIELEEMMQIAEDLKKRIIFDKGRGTWSWYDADEESEPMYWHTNFPTFLAALKNVVEPYMEEDEA